MKLYDDIAALNNSIDFLKIYDGKRPYYGGTQSWFKENTLKHVGCSVVAAANITAYIAQMTKNITLYDFHDMSKDNFLCHMESIAQFIHPDSKKGVTSVSYFDSEVLKFASRKHVSLIPHITTNKDYFTNVRAFIKEALSLNKPVALLMLKNSVLSEFDWHWMTLTRLFETGDKTYLDFSTWGERRIFTLEDFYKYSSYGALTYFDCKAS